MRFGLPAYPTNYFSERIWVQCPNCQEPALVRTILTKDGIKYPHGYQSQCSCSHCGFHRSNNSKWSGYVQGFIHRSCGFCGASIAFISEPSKTSFATKNIQCEHCNQERKYEVKWLKYQADKPTDPYFGFELWLQTSIKGRILWLYNLAHLKYLRAYVMAQLREDGGRHKYSMITNLPQWIKAAKNRELIVKALHKLEEHLMQKIKQH